MFAWVGLNHSSGFSLARQNSISAHCLNVAPNYLLQRLCPQLISFVTLPLGCGFSRIYRDFACISSWTSWIGLLLKLDNPWKKLLSTRSRVSRANFNSSLRVYWDCAQCGSLSSKGHKESESSLSRKWLCYGLCDWDTSPAYRVARFCWFSWEPPCLFADHLV